ncbi:MAG: 3-hydroxyacyl-CoA dehydrogenase family protein [Planctomycetaceae bacterium]|nr:3-hydroxyacyl-CoA dehydrogenase family protein [Planctomycetaceae bacterium]
MMDQTTAGFPPSQIQSVGILGCGTMGKGIALANVRAGLSVKLFDINKTVAEQTVETIRRDLQSPTLPRAHAASGSTPSLISLAATEKEIGESDLIIETVPEDETLKKTILTQLDPHLREDSIVATNTSSIPITQLAGVLTDPTRMCGLHFCHPVHDRPLVEVVETKFTTPKTMRQALAYVQTLGKAPLRIADSPGFLLNRLLVPYLNEALELLLKGAEPDILDQAARSFGMPIGPLRQLDEYGLDVALAVGKTLYRAFPDRIFPSELLIAMYKAGRLGRKSGQGFYDWSATPDNNPTTLVQQTLDLIQKRRRTTETFSMETVSRRLWQSISFEAARICDEQLVDGPERIDQALVDGLGMTPMFQGLLTYATAS